jgi:polyferredoxin
MDRIEKPRGLVGFYSEKGLNEKSKFFTGRVWSYTILLTFLLGVITVLFWLRTDFDVNILRERGTLYQKTVDGDVRNIYRLEIINKTPNAGHVDIRLLSPEGSVSISGDALEIKKNARIERLLIIDIEPDQLSGLSNEVSLGVYVEGEQVEIIETKFLAPQ